jgi:hypothetical protein
VAYVTIVSVGETERILVVGVRPLRRPDSHVDYLRDEVPKRLMGGGSPPRVSLNPYRSEVHTALTSV